MLEQFGLILNGDPIIDGDEHRVGTDGKPRSKNGWYVGHWDGDHIHGGYGDWADPDNFKSYSSKSKTEFTEVDRERHKQLATQREEKRRAKQAEAAKRAVKVAPTLSPCPDDHPYLKQKQVIAGQTKIDSDGNIAVVMTDSDGKIWNIQRIFPGGDKKFLYGGMVSGCFHKVKGNDSILYICEGYATGLTIHQTTGYSVIVAFNAGNLHRVTQAIRIKLPDAHLVIAADNDHKTIGKGKPQNTGLDKGKAVARSFSCDLVYPDGIDGTDFNDMATELGIDMVKEALDVTEEETATKSVRKGNYRLTMAGVYFVEENSEGEEVSHFVCSRLEVVAAVRDGDSEKWADYSGSEIQTVFRMSGQCRCECLTAMVQNSERFSSILVCI